MTDPFYSSKFSIDWAYDHIAEFERETETFLQPDNYCIVSELDADGTHNLLKFKLTKPMPRALNGHALDVVYNLRAALDQTICSVATLNKTPADNTFFPIRTKGSDFETALNGLRKYAPDEILDLVRKFKPYKGGNNLLWALNKLCNTNKHGILRPLPMAATDVTAEGTSQGKAFRLWLNPQWDSFKNEMILVTALVNAKFTMNFDYSFFIGFSDIEFINGKPVVTTLDKFASEVNRIVMAIEAESKRIGLV
jgi:hypothetical protein